MNLAELFHLETDVLNVPAGEPLFKAGDGGDKMFVLLSGSASVRVGDTEVETAGPGTLLGEMALVGDTPRTATVTATTDCRFVAIDQRRFHFLVTQTPHFATHVMKVMADRLRRMDQRLAGQAANH
jgi:CRP/FNR family transcriptional regulator, cyclic AMP receptor protein